MKKLTQHNTHYIGRTHKVAYTCGSVTVLTLKHAFGMAYDERSWLVKARVCGTTQGLAS